MESRKAFDALAAGLDQFGNKMSAVANNINRVTSDLQERFAEVTGTKTVGKINQINPFTKENITTASNATIDSAVNQMKALGPDQATGDAAFKDTADMMKGLRDFPLAMRDIL